MTLSLPTVEDRQTQYALDRVAQQFPVRARFFEPVVTALPTNAQDGQVVTYLADATNGVVWLLRYRAASASAYKWEYLGGPSLAAFVDTNEATTGAAYGALTTAGPSVTVPLAGDYMVASGSDMHGTAGGTGGWHSYSVGAAAAVDADAAVAAFDAAGREFTVAVTRRKTGLVASAALVSKYKHFGAAVDIQKRWMQVQPVRVG